MCKLDNLIFHDADKAREYLEAKLWPNGLVCPHCGNADPARINGVEGQGAPPRPLHLQ